MLGEMLITIAAAAAPLSVGAPNVAAAEPRSVTLSVSEMFALADAAAQHGEKHRAEALYRALTTNPSLEVRSEARFRLAMLLVQQRRHTDGAVLLRRILDEQPNAQRVRIELAAVLATIGDEAAARRELRAARAGDLPPQVVQLVDRFSAALRARKPTGGSLQVAVASDSNMNRATRSDTLGTVIGDFVLDEDARAQSGRGISAQGQGFSRLPLGGRSTLLGTLSAAGNFYRKARFNDATLGAALGPELRVGRTRVQASLGGVRRWYGGERFADAANARVDLARPINPVTQLTGSAAVNRVWNRRNPLESGWSYSGAVGAEMAFSPKSGAGISLTGLRQALRDPGYSVTSGQLMLFGYREAGSLTFTGAFTGGRLRADKRLLIYPDRRQEKLYRTALGVTARQVQLGGFSPLVTLSWERNRSGIAIYDYRRTLLNVGATRAF